MELRLSKRVQRIKPSPTLTVTARAAALKAEGHDIIGLGAGEPDFDTPAHIKEAAKRALDRGFTKYTAVDGIPSLKQAIIRKFQRDNRLTYAPEQIVVSCGGKQCFYNLAQALLDPGDEVVIPAPYWVSYPDMVLLADGVPVIVEGPVEEGFKVTPQRLTAAIGPRTRMLVINSPSNPTGVCYTAAELAALGEVLRAHPHVLVATDDMYEHVVWGEAPFANIVMACPDLYERTIVLSGVSKSYSMTGWRIGYAAGPAPLIRAMVNVQSQSTSNPTSFAQVAAETALDGDQSFIAEMVQAFKARHDYVVAALNRLRGVRCLPAQGAFYLFPEIHEAMRARNAPDDVAFADWLLREAGVAVVPGSAFGAPGFMRISIATAMETLERAMERLEQVLGRA